MREFHSIPLSLKEYAARRTRFLPALCLTPFIGRVDADGKPLLAQVMKRRAAAEKELRYQNWLARPRHTSDSPIDILSDMSFGF